MNEIEKQILENQKAIMTHSQANESCESILLFLQHCIEKTTMLLCPNQRQEESSCEMDEDTKRSNRE